MSVLAFGADVPRPRAGLARVQTEVALTALLRRFPNLALAVAAEDVQRVPGPGCWRLASLPVTL